MKQKLFYVSQMLMAIGRIIAGLALLHYRAVFWTLRIFTLVCIAAAAYRLVTAYADYMLIGAVMVCVGGLFIVWTHSLVTKHPVQQGRLIVDGPFAVVRHPMYSGCALLTAGCAVMASMWPVTVLAVLETIMMLSFCCGEDEENFEIFAPDYKQYSSRVRLTGIFIGLARLLVRGKAGTAEGTKT